MAFQVVEKNRTGGSGRVQITVYADGTTRLTAAADRQLGRPDAVRFKAGTGEDAGKLMLEPADESEADAYSCSRGTDAGADLNTTVVMRDWVGVDLDALEQRHTPPLEIADDGTHAIADCRDLPGVDAGTDEQTADADDLIEAVADRLAEADDDDTDSDEVVDDDDDLEETVATNGHATPDEEETPPWRDGERDRRERVRLYVAAMVNELGALKSTYADIAEQIGRPDAHGNAIRFDLEALEGYDVEPYDETDDGTAVWRITEAEDDVEDDTNAGDEDEEDTVDTLAGQYIEIEDQTGTRQLEGYEVVDAIAGAPGKHRAKAPLNLSTTGFENLLEELDLTAIFEAEAPLATDYVRETVQQYLEVTA